MRWRAFSVPFFRSYRFFAFLEGGTANVLSVNTSMTLVQHHKNVTSLFDQAITRRVFADWAMSLIKWDDLDAAQQVVF